MAHENGKKQKIQMDRVCLVPCRITPGMFREEYLVSVDALDPQNPSNIVKAQLLVDQREVSEIQGTPKRSQPATGWLRVTLVEKRGELANVVLPQPSQPLGERILVSAGTIKKAAGP